LEDLQVQPADEKLRRYKSSWLQSITRMNKNRKQKNKAEPQVKIRQVGRPLKKLLDAAEIGLLRPNLLMDDDDTFL